MWEVLHLFSRHARGIRVQSHSSLDSLVSAYSSITAAGDSMTVILVNRDTAAAQVAVGMKGFSPAATGISLQLAGLVGETFVSHTQNALKSGSVAFSAGSCSLVLPAYSVTALKVPSVTSAAVAKTRHISLPLVRMGMRVIGESGERLELFDLDGRVLRTGTGNISLVGLATGLYLVHGNNRTLQAMIP